MNGMRSEIGGWTYIMVSRRNGTLYTGSTRDLIRRVWEHRSKIVPGFTRTHDVTMLVWFEPYESVASAYGREKRIKRWRRAWKLELIETMNPQWRDLWEDVGNQY